MKLSHAILFGLLAAYSFAATAFTFTGTVKGAWQCAADDFKPMEIIDFSGSLDEVTGAIQSVNESGETMPFASSYWSNNTLVADYTAKADEAIVDHVRVAGTRKGNKFNGYYVREKAGCIFAGPIKAKRVKRGK